MMMDSLLNQIYGLLEDPTASVSIDTRTLKKNDVFVAIKGESFNGNLFAQQALDAGAALVVVDEDVSISNPKVVQVDDSLVFLQHLATQYRRRFDIPVIGIAGSNGKTTTKELLHAATSTAKVTYSTPGNFNNHIGVPLTILQWKKDIEVAIVELGTNSPGEIAFLCEIAQPNYGIITNIGKEHLEGFGNLEAVAKEESALYYYLLKNNGIAFVNAQDEWLMRMANRLENKVFYHAAEEEPSDLAFTPFITFTYRGETVKSQVSGRHNYENILAALSIAQHMEVPINEAIKGINAYRPSMNRNEIIEEGSTTIIKDAYNANPSSMEKAIELLVDFDPSKKKLAILGDMFEMGEHAPAEHQHIVDFAKSKDLEIVLIGEAFGKTDFHGKCFVTVADAGEYLSQINCSETVILLKGSRGMKMENVLDHLTF